MYSQAVVSFMAGAAMANGQFKEAEKQVISLIAPVFQVSTEDLLNAIESEIAHQKELSTDNLKAYFADRVQGLTLTEALSVMESCITICLADDELGKDEAELLLNFAEMLKVTPLHTVMLISFYVYKNKNLTVKLEM